MTHVDPKSPLANRHNPEEIYITIRAGVISAQNRIAGAVNAAMVTAYHGIGEQICRACGDNDRAEYGKKLLEYLSDRLTAELGEGFPVRNLRAMRQFYSVFPIRHTLCAELSWSHYRLLMRIADKEAREFYMTECAKSAWSVRQLERQIHNTHHVPMPSPLPTTTRCCPASATQPIRHTLCAEFSQICPIIHIFNPANKPQNP